MVMDVCGGALTALSTWQDITSPDYPAQYPDNTDCIWTINDPASDDAMVTLKVN